MLKFRLAKQTDVESVAEIYNKIHSREESGQASTGWKRNIYPTKETAEKSFGNNELFVGEYNGKVVASGRINQEQGDEYSLVPWSFAAEDSEVMVLHTLTVDPNFEGRGFAKAFIKFYENYALQNGCGVLRIDTNEINVKARNMYRKAGYREAAVVPCTFNGIAGVNLVCLEKKL